MTETRKSFSQIFAFLFLIVLFSSFALPVFALEWPNSPVGTSFEPTCDTNIDPPGCTPSTLTTMIKYLYEWAVVLGGLAAFVMLVVAGIQYLTSTGDPGKAKDARDRITSAIGGLVLLLSSFILLNILNPELTTLRTPSFSAPPTSSCARVEIYSEKNFGGNKIEIAIDRNTGTSQPTPIPNIKDKGSTKFFVFAKDDPNDNTVKEGGVCGGQLYESTNCQGEVIGSLTATKDTSKLGIKKPSGCARVTDSVLANLPPVGSCAKVEIYPKKNYQGSPAVVIVDRNTGDSAPTKIPDMKKDGSIKFFAFASDDPADPQFNTIKEGGLCTGELHESTNCQGEAVSPLLPTKNVGNDFQLKKTIKCVIVR